ncbi:hypothetical protein KC315_g11571 [Hortaea werneckii]|nr:hypothetical protein KC315_g11571 [Hortaea werneckii]
MIRPRRHICKILTPLHASQPRFRSTKAARINVTQPFEEERLPWYHADQFYPVHIGQTFISRYKAVGKLGYGAYSTVWLCRDLKASDFVSVKVGTSHGAGPMRQDRELKFYEHVASLGSQHPGGTYIRGLLETFEISGPTGKHLCLVQPPMHMTVAELQRQNPTRRLDKELLNWTLFDLLSALSFLHDEAKVADSVRYVIDINPSNIMLTIDDESLLPAFEQEEASNSSPRKVIDDTRTVYGSRKLGLPKDALWGQPVLCDFGEARTGPGPHKGLIQPELYRAPEVLFEMGWDSSADIWNVAVMWKSAGGVVIPHPEAMSLERAETVLEGEEKTRFLGFVRSMLKWAPEERLGAEELLRDPWLEGAIPS